MGGAPVNYLNTGAVLLFAYLAVFVEACPGGLRNWVHTQIDLLPALMVYCGLSTGLTTLCLTAVLGGLWLDSFSSNPLGISVLPYFLVGFSVYRTRELILRDQPYARLLLGFAACVLTPFLTVLLLLGGGYRPLIGWGSLWQWLIMAVVGGLLTPIICWFFERLNAALAYRRASETSFRPDREIKRGRA